MNDDDLERWINLEGPPPTGVRELLDAVCDVSEMTPELEARLERRVYAALAVDRRRRAWLRALKRVLGGGLVAGCLAGAALLVIHLTAPPELAVARRVQPEVNRPATAQLGGTESTVQSAAPMVSATPAPQEAGRAAGRRPGSEAPPPRLRRVRPSRRDPGLSLGW